MDNSDNLIPFPARHKAQPPKAADAKEADHGHNEDRDPDAAQDVTNVVDASNSVIDFTMARTRRRIKQTFFFLDAFSSIPDPDDGSWDVSLGMAHLQFSQLVRMVEPGSPLEDELRQNSEAIATCKRVMAGRLALGQEMKETERSFLERIGALPTDEDIQQAQERQRPKSSWEREQDLVGDITGSVLRGLYPDGIKDRENYLSVIEVHPIVDYILAAQQRDSRHDSSPIEKAIPREWVVTAAAAAIRQKPACEKDVWKIIRYFWTKYNLDSYEGIENDILKRLGRPTELQARDKASQMLFTWMNDMASGRHSESKIMQWIFERYQYNFVNGKNKEYGDLFGDVYLDELAVWIEKYNASLVRRRAEIEEKEIRAAEKGDETGETFSMHDELEKDELGRTKEIDAFFIKRLVNYFAQRGVILKQ